MEQMRSEGLIQNGDRVVVTHGDGKIFRQNTSHSVRVKIVQNAPSAETKMVAENLSSDEFIAEADFENGKILLDTQICASCQNCVSVCPHGIWAVTTDMAKLTYIDQGKAPDCSLDMACVENCPTGAIEIISKK